MYPTITISDKARALAALNNEIDVLFKQSAEVNSQYVAAKEQYENEIKLLSGRHNVILNNIIAMEDAIAKIML